MLSRAARHVINDLAEHGSALCEIPVHGGIEVLARDLPQRAFAGALGLDVQTLEDWELGLRTRDASALALVALFDRDPSSVEQAMFEPVPRPAPLAKPLHRRHHAGPKVERSHARKIPMIVCFGSINLDLIFPLPHLPHPGETVLGREMKTEPGGKGANQAVAAARDGAIVLFAGAVGRDSLADQALVTMIASGVDLSRVIRAATSTGCASICVDPHGANHIAVAAGANLFAHAAQVEDALLVPGNTLLLQAETPLAEIAALIRRARNGGARVVLNLAPAAKLDADALKAVDVLVVNEDEGAAIGAMFGTGGDAASLHTALGVDVVLTLGGDGLSAATRAGAFRLPVYPVTAVDTTGAGDCFTGVLAAGLDRGLTFADAVRRANVAAALACSRAGSQGSMPMANETDAAVAA